MRYKLWLVLALLMLPVVSAGLESVTGTVDKDSNKVSHSFLKIDMTVTPETYYTTPEKQTFQHYIHVKNTDTQNLYYFFDAYFSENITNAQILDVQPTKTVIKSISTEKWGGKEHYRTDYGVYVKSGTNATFKLSGKIDNKGERVVKWDARIWASEYNDYSCVVYDNCTFDVSIDPQANMTYAPTSTSQRMRNGVGFNTSTPQMHIQSFILNSSDNTNGNVTLDRIETLWKASAHNSAETIYVGVYNDNGNGVPLGAEIMNITLGQPNITTLGAADNFIDFIFANNSNLTLEVNRSYVFAMGYSGGNPEIVNTAYSSSDVYSDGRCSIKVDGETWIRTNVCDAAVSNRDLYFNITYNVTAVPTDDNSVGGNITYTNPFNETTLQNVQLNASLGANVTNLTAVSLVYNNTNLTVAFQQSLSNTTSIVYNATIRAPLVENNGTPITMVWYYSGVLDNGTNETLSNTSVTNVTFSFYPQSISALLNVTETSTQNITANFTNFGNSQGVSFNWLIQWNNTNYTATNYVNDTLSSNASASFTTPLANFFQDNVTIQSWVNVTFDGVTVLRNGSVEQQQTDNQIVLFKCSDASPNNSTIFINNTILDEQTGLTISTSDLTANYDVRIAGGSTSRQYALTYTNHTSSVVCGFPHNETLETVYNYTFGADGYGTRTTTANITTSNVTTNITLLLLKSSEATDIIITVVDQDDDSVINASITIELFNNSNYTLLDQGLTDFQGQRQFSLDLSNTYRINITNTAGDLFNLTSGIVASQTFQILTTELTFRVLTAAGSSLQPLIDITAMPHTLTFTNSSGFFELFYNDTGGATTSVCLNVYNVSNASFTLFDSQCSTNTSQNLFVNISTFTGSWLAQAVANSTLDARQYLFNSLSVYRPVQSAYGREGTIWAVGVIGTSAFMGMVVSGGNPAGLIMGTLLGIGASFFLDLLAISWLVFAGIAVIGGIFIYLLRT